MSDDGSIMAMIFLAVALIAYFLPTIVANSRGRDSQGMIFLGNLLFGWTVIGWVVLLIVSFTGESGAARRHREEELKLLRQMASTQAKPSE